MYHQVSKYLLGFNGLSKRSKTQQNISSSTINHRSNSSRIIILANLKIIGLLFSTLLILLLPPNCAGTYREHFVHSEKICPNPLHLPHGADEFPKNTLLVNLPKTLSLFGTHVNDFPCNFASSSGTVKKVIVRAIHPSTASWDFSTAQTCDYFIKFKRGDPTKTSSNNNGLNNKVKGRLDNSKKEEVICRVWKQQHALHQGSFFHPMMWNSPNSKMTLSFSTYNWEYRLENNDTILYKPVYLQMVFLVYGENENYCSLRVQQYLIDPMENIKSNCSSDTINNYQHCGQYECSKAKSLLQSMGFRTYEIDDELEARNNNNNLSKSTGAENDDDDRGNNKLHNGSAEDDDDDDDEDGDDIEGRHSQFGATEETERSVSTIDQYDIFKTTTRTITFYNNNNSNNSIISNFHSYAVGSIILVPLVVLIVAVVAIRCYIIRCHKGFPSSHHHHHYESRESLIVPLEHAMMNTHVTLHGTVELDGDGTPLYRSSWTRNNSMDYIQPIDLRNNLPLSNAPSYEKFGPPRYSDAVVI